MKKNIVSIMLIFVLIFSLCACNKTEEHKDLTVEDVFQKNAELVNAIHSSRTTCQIDAIKIVADNNNEGSVEYSIPVSYQATEMENKSNIEVVTTILENYNAQYGDHSHDIFEKKYFYGYYQDQDFVIQQWLNDEQIYDPSIDVVSKSDISSVKLLSLIQKNPENCILNVDDKGFISVQVQSNMIFEIIKQHQLSVIFKDILLIFPNADLSSAQVTIYYSPEMYLSKITISSIVSLDNQNNMFTKTSGDIVFTFDQYNNALDIVLPEEAEIQKQIANENTDAFWKRVYNICDYIDDMYIKYPSKEDQCFYFSVDEKSFEWDYENFSKLREQGTLDFVQNEVAEYHVDNIPVFLWMGNTTAYIQFGPTASCDNKVQLGEWEFFKTKLSNINQEIVSSTQNGPYTICEFNVVNEDMLKYQCLLYFNEDQVLCGAKVIFQLL